MATDLGPTDDGTTMAVPIGFPVTFFGTSYPSLYVNCNGYVTFDAPVTSIFRGTAFRRRLIAPFFADVDTLPTGSGTVHYGADTVDGRPAFGVTWPGVGYYMRHADKLDTFQLVIIERSDTGSGHFDVEFNYGTIVWESGDSSDGGAGGVGGTPSAMVGYSSGVDDTLLPGSGTPGSFLDTNPVTGLVHGQRDSGVPGRYVFEFRHEISDASPDAPLDGPPDVQASLDAGRREAAPGTSAASPDGSSAGGCSCRATDRAGSWYAGALWVLLASAIAARRRARRR